MNEFYWDVQNQYRMGQYLGAVEQPFIDRCLDGENVNTIIDIGGGSGRFALPLEARGYRVTVVETQTAALEALRRHSPTTPAVQTSTEPGEWPIATNAVDCALAIQVPITHKAWFWEECRRMLTKGGLVIGWMTNRVSYKGLLYNAKRPFVPAENREWYDLNYMIGTKELREIAASRGFRVESMLGYNWMPQGRSSDSALIPELAHTEDRLGLRRAARISPWVIFKARLGEPSR